MKKTDTQQPVEIIQAAASSLVFCEDIDPYGACYA